MNTRPTVVLEALAVGPRPAGVALGILDLVRALSECEQDMDFVVLTSDAQSFQELEGRPGWTVARHPEAAGSGFRKAWFVQTALPRLCRNWNADLLHNLQFVTPWRMDIPQVATVHDLTFRILPDTIETTRLWYYRTVVPRSLRVQRLLLANSNSTADALKTHFPGLADRIRVIAHGTPTWVLEGSDSTTGSPPVTPYFLFVGTREPRKNLPGLLEAYRRYLGMAADLPEAGIPDLVVVGAAGWNSGNLDSKMANLRSLGKIRFLDYQDHQALRSLYKNALALAFPSLHEGFGLPVLEAMALGCPVLTSQGSGMEEIAGGAALLVDPRDSDSMARGLLDLTLDSRLRDRLVEAGFGQVLNWSWKRTAVGTKEVYREALGLREDK